MDCLGQLFIILLTLLCIALLAHETVGFIRMTVLYVLPLQVGTLSKNVHIICWQSIQIDAVRRYNQLKWSGNCDCLPENWESSGSKSQ